MKYLMLGITILCVLACESEQLIEPEEPIEEVTEIQTAVLKFPSRTNNLRRVRGNEGISYVLPDDAMYLATQAGVPTLAYMVEDGDLKQEQIIFQEEYYHLLWCYLDEQPVHVNVLEHKIPYISQKDALVHLDNLFENDKDARKRLEEIGAEEEKHWNAQIAALGGVFIDPGKGWVDAKGKTILKINDDGHFIDKKGNLIVDTQGNPIHNEGPRPSDIRWEQEFSIHPFHAKWYGGPPDELEVVIKNWFNYENGKQMIFVKILRNLTRPHITY